MEDKMDKKVMKEEAKETAVANDAVPQKGELDKPTQAYLSAMMKMLHDPKSSPAIVETLQQGDPRETIPMLALTLNDNFEGELTKQGKKPELKTLLVAGTYLVADLIEIGNAAGAFQLGEEEVPPLLQSTMQMYIEKGLKDGSIDPVELQEAVEPLMGEEHRNAGALVARDSGLPERPDQQTAMAAYGQEQRRGALKEAEQMAAQKQAQAPPQAPPQGGQ